MSKLVLKLVLIWAAIMLGSTLILYHTSPRPIPVTIDGETFWYSR